MSNASDSCFTSEFLYEAKETKGSLTFESSLTIDTNIYSWLGRIVASGISSISTALEAFSLILSTS